LSPLLPSFGLLNQNHGATILTIAIILRLLFHHQKIKQSFLRAVLQVVLDQGLDLPEKILNLRGLKPFLVITLIVSTIFTNLYRGILTTSVTSPLPVTGLEEVEQAITLSYKILISIRMKSTVQSTPLCCEQN